MALTKTAASNEIPEWLQVRNIRRHVATIHGVYDVEFYDEEGFPITDSPEKTAGNLDDDRSYIDTSLEWPPAWEGYYTEAEPTLPTRGDVVDEGKFMEDSPAAPPFQRIFPDDEFTRRSLFPITDVASDSGVESSIEKSIELEEVEDQHPEFTRERLARDQEASRRL